MFTVMVYRKALQVIRFIGYVTSQVMTIYHNLILFMDETPDESRFTHKVHERCDSGYIRFFSH